MLAVKTDGTLWSWGVNNSGQLGDGSTTSRSSPGTVAGGGTTWKQVACGYRHALAIKTDGTLWSWGLNDNGQLGTGDTTNRSSPGSVVSNSTWKQVACGYKFSLGLAEF
jgi:alpha-tubulin suppressor-like RCC1 family protein